jgi:hypothetical protein
MCLRLQSQNPDDVTLSHEYVHIRQIRASIYIKSSDYRVAAIDLRLAKATFNGLFAFDPGSRLKLNQIEDLEVQLLMNQGQYGEARRMLHMLLANPEPNADPVKIAQRHYYMAFCAERLGESITSLEHSQ